MSRRFRKSNSSTFKDLQTQIQGLSKIMSDFKDFPGLKIWKKNSRTFKDFQKSVEQDSCVSLKNLELAGK